MTQIHRLLPKATVAVAASLAVLSLAANTPAAEAQTNTPDASAARLIAAGGNDTGYDMAPETGLEVVQAAVAAIPRKIPAGPVQPTWESLKANYKVPEWYVEAKFGLSFHWGLYSVPAYHNEWYEKHMYGTYASSGIGNISGRRTSLVTRTSFPMFTAKNFDPNAWADLFKKSGARWIAPTVQHHDNFRAVGQQGNAVQCHENGAEARSHGRIGQGRSRPRTQIRRLQPRHRKLPVHQSAAGHGRRHEGQTGRPLRSEMGGLLQRRRPQR